MQPKKNNIKLLIDAISIECSNKSEILQIKNELSKFKREVPENFAKTVNRFDALYTHLAQLKAPITGQELSRLSLNTLEQITPHLVHPKTAKTYGKWLEAEVTFNRPVTRESIISTINTLEQSEEHKLDRDRTLPKHMAATQLGFDSNEHTIGTFLISQPPPSKMPPEPNAEGRTAQPGKGQ